MAGLGSTDWDVYVYKYVYAAGRLRSRPQACACSQMVVRQYWHDDDKGALVHCE